MKQDEPIEACWSRLAADRQVVLDKAYRYAALTLPRLLTQPGTNADSEEQSHDFQSIGAVAVNHVVNKLALAMFSPASPFFKIRLTSEAKAKFQEGGVSPADMDTALAALEREAAGELDGTGQRVKLYQVLVHLVVLGNVGIHFEKDEFYVYALDEFVVKRTQRGRLHTAIIRECVQFDELDDDIKEVVPARSPETQVYHYTLLSRAMIGGKPHIKQRTFVDNVEITLPAYTGRWEEAECPFHFLTWTLAHKANYGSGLVEEYAGDLESLSALSQSTVTGAILGAEFRYLLNPTMMTKVEDWNKSRNGDALAGNKGDIDVITGGNPEALRTAIEAADKYERRVSRAFLLNSAVTRDAERVTAEEIRMTAIELETAFGGTYTALAAILQRPVANWLLARIDPQLPHDKDAKVVVLTGLDALSRTGEIEQLRLAFSDLGLLAQLPPIMLERLKLDELATFIGSRRGVDFSKFLKTDAEIAKAREAAAAQQAQAAGMMSAAESAGQEPQ